MKIVYGSDLSGKLLPCPFCGAGETHIVDTPLTENGIIFYKKSRISILHWCHDTDGYLLPGKIEKIGIDLESAIAAWNMRASLKRDEK